MAAALLGRLSLTDRLLQFAYVSTPEAIDSDSFVRTASYLSILAYVLAGVAFLLWLHRAVANNYALGARRLTFTPGWAVGWWFVPFVNLVRPAQVVDEAWRAADPHVMESTPDTRRASGSHGLVATWWALWLIGLIGSVVATVGINSGDTPSSLHDSTAVSLVALIVRVIACAVAIVIVLGLSARQAKKAAARGMLAAR